MFTIAVIFLFTGLLFSSIGGILLVESGDWLCLVHLLIGCVLLIAGGVSLDKAIQARKAERNVLKNGRKVPNCKLVEFIDDTSTTVNGRHPYVMVFQDEAGQEYCSSFPTLDYRYEEGQYYNIYVLDDLVAVERIK